MTLETTLILYKGICNDLVKLFAEKQDLEFYGWAGGTVGEVAGFADYFFNLSDIIYDLETNQKKGLIMEWNDYYMEAHYDKKDHVNYKSYSKGLR